MKVLLDKIMEFIFLFSLFISISLLFGYSIASFANEIQIAEVGRYDSSGKIQLKLSRFNTTFPDGGAIDKISVMERDGFIYVIRKGFDQEGVCRSEQVELVDRDFTPITTGSDPMEGTPVFLMSRSNSYRLSCQDNGCRALNNQTNQFAVNSAVCDITDASQFRCACQISGENMSATVQNDNLCLSVLRPVSKVVMASWIPSCSANKDAVPGATRGVAIIPC